MSNSIKDWSHEPRDSKKVFYEPIEETQILIIVSHKTLLISKTWEKSIYICLYCHGRTRQKRVFRHMRRTKAHITRTSAQNDQKLHCPLVESFATTERMSGEQMSGLYFAHVQDYPNLCILLMFEGSFSLDMARNLIGSIIMTCGSKIAKLIPFVNQRWPPWLAAWNSVSNLFSRTERPVYSKHHWKYLGDGQITALGIEKCLRPRSNFSGTQVSDTGTSWPSCFSVVVVAVLICI